MAITDLRPAPKPGRPYPERADEAYLAWALRPDKGRAVIPSLSKDLDIPERLLYDWRVRFKWEERWVHDIQGARNRMIAEGEAVLLTHLRPGMERLGRIVATGTDRDATQALKLLAQIVGLIDTGGNKLQVNIAGVSPELIAQAKDLSLRELKAGIQQIGQTNIDAARAKRSN